MIMALDALHSGPDPMPDARRLIASLPQGFVLLDPDLMIAQVNPAAEQLIGQSASRLIGRLVNAVFAFEEPLILERLTERGAQLVAPASLVQIANQPARPINVVTAPVLHFPGWQILVLQEPVVVDALTRGGGDDDGGPALHAPAVLAHEIKNPLAGIRGAAQLLDRQLGEKERALTGLITTEVDRIAKLIDQMQSLSRRSPEPAVACNLHEAARQAQAILAAGRAAGEAARVIVEEEFDPSLPLITANHDALVQVLINLLVNAIDACQAQVRPRIIVRTRYITGIQVHHGPGGKTLRLPIELRVSDNGPGVPVALHHHIFEPFVSSKKHGQGLGLALVQKLVREMNGRVTHDRDEARGLTHFRLHLPVAGSVAVERSA
jgi:two-component system nitrogen regulation sensor histidine kinase GlnL